MASIMGIAKRREILLAVLVLAAGASGSREATTESLEHLLEELALPGDELHGFLARAEDPDGSYHLIESGEIPFEDQSFDVAFSSFVFHKWYYSTRMWKPWVACTATPF